MERNFNTADLVTLFRAIAARIAEERDHLGELDGQIGDADHGASMARGFEEVVRRLSAVDPAQLPLPEAFALAARSFLNAVGASTGPLYASAFLRAATVTEGRATLPPHELPRLIIAMAEGIQSRGKAEPGDKTMMDAWAPAARAARQGMEAQAPVARILHAARDAAIEGRDATRAMIASKGRAARLGARSLGHLDPGAASAAAIIDAMVAALENLR